MQYNEKDEILLRMHLYFSSKRDNAKNYHFWHIYTNHFTIHSYNRKQVNLIRFEELLQIYKIIIKNIKSNFF